MYLKKSINENIELHKSLLKLQARIDFTIKKMFQSLTTGNKILICGNGGSAADAQHLAAEFLIRLKPKINRQAFPVISLAQDTSTITACGNDIGFSNIFSRTLSALGNKGDILIAISTSGKSKNIIKVLKQAKSQKIFSIAFLGSGGGEAKKLANINLIVKGSVTARIQEAHIFLGHVIFEQVEKLMLKKNKNEK
jgi:D-sedoheptulose 7-phosphate isomerase